MAKNRQGYFGQDRRSENRGREPKWVLKEVGESVFGIREKRWFDENQTGSFSNSDREAFSNSDREAFSNSDREAFSHEANRAFREAKEKQRLLTSDYLERNFFQLFGEPDKIEVSPEKK